LRNYVLISFSIVIFGILFFNSSAFAEESHVIIPLGKEQGCKETSSCFLPFSLIVKAGDKVTWINDDINAHTVTAGDLLINAFQVGLDYPNGFDSSLIGVGSSWSYTFVTPGEYPYFSQTKPWMVGVVFVEESEFQPEEVVAEPEIPPESVEPEILTEESSEEVVAEPETTEDISTKPIQDAFIFLDPPISTDISQGDAIIVTGQFVTGDGDPIPGKELYVESTDADGNSFFSYETTDEDGEFYTEAFFFVRGESSFYAEFEGDEEFNPANEFLVFEVTIGTEESSTESQESDSLLPEVGLPSIELPAIELPGVGGCLIATATFGTELSPQVQLLREIRDNVVLNTNSGTTFMTGFNQLYYSFSPSIADLEREHPFFKEIVKVIVTPLLTSLLLLNNVEIHSEEEMLGYGIGIIVINMGMYFVAPLVIISKLRKVLYFKK